ASALHVLRRPLDLHLVAVLRLSRASDVAAQSYDARHREHRAPSLLVRHVSAYGYARSPLPRVNGRPRRRSSRGGPSARAERTPHGGTRDAVVTVPHRHIIGLSMSDLARADETFGGVTMTAFGPLVILRFDPGWTTDDFGKALDRLLLLAPR